MIAIQEMCGGIGMVQGRGIAAVIGERFGRHAFHAVVGIVFSNLVMFFIIVIASATLHASGIISVQTADQAAQALKPIGGGPASFLFALGIVGTGLLAAPVLAVSTPYAVAESLGRRSGPYRKFKDAHGFYASSPSPPSSGSR